MNAYEYENVSEMYRDIVRLLCEQKSDHSTKELTNVMLKVNDVRDALITERKISLPYLCGELLWYMMESNQVDFISKFAKKWSEISDDGETSNSAYGYILGQKHGFNQVEKIIELLKQDPYSRRAVMNLNVPNEKVIETKDEICTIALQFLVRDGKLHCLTMMRSNDVYRGMPYDIAFFTSLQKMIAYRLRILSGTYTHVVGSLHLYDSDEEKLLSAMSEPQQDYKLKSLCLLDLKQEDYDKINNSTSPKEDVVKLFVEKNIIEMR